MSVLEIKTSVLEILKGADLRGDNLLIEVDRGEFTEWRLALEAYEHDSLSLWLADNIQAITGKKWGKQYVYLSVLRLIEMLNIQPFRERPSDLSYYLLLDYLINNQIRESEVIVLSSWEVELLFNSIPYGRSIRRDTEFLLPYAKRGELYALEKELFVVMVAQYKQRHLQFIDLD